MGKYGGVVSKVSYLHSGDSTDRADLAQEMLIRIWRSIERFDHRCKPSTWIYRICLNTALTWKRDAGRRDRHSREHEHHVGMLERSSQEGSGATEDRIEALYDSMRKLSPLDRTLVQLSLDGLSYLEIADVTGLTESNIGSRLTRARRQLATLIKKGVDNDY